MDVETTSAQMTSPNGTAKALLTLNDHTAGWGVTIHPDTRRARIRASTGASPARDHGCDISPPGVGMAQGITGRRPRQSS